MTEVSFYWMTTDGKKVAGPWQTFDDANDSLRRASTMVKVTIDGKPMWVPKKEVSVFVDETEDDGLKTYHNQ